MTTVAERKCALFLASLRGSDRRSVLGRLPRENARRIRALVDELRAQALPLEELAAELLADEVRGLTAMTSPALEDLMRLAERIDAQWFARVLAVWPNINVTFCLSLLPAERAAAVKRELATFNAPPRLAAALQAEAAAMATRGVP